MSKSIIKHALATAGILTLFTVAGTAMLTGTFETTKAPIAKSEREARLHLFSQVLPPSLHDNDLLQDAVELPPTEALGQHAASKAYRARMKGQPAGVILEVIAPDGYSGEIKLLVGIAADGGLTGVRVLAHKETPGLGDYIDLAHSNWIKNFDGQSLAKTPDEGWKVKKDGGQFDYMALQYFDTQREIIFPVPNKAALAKGETA